MGANAHPGAYRLLSTPAAERKQSAMSSPDQLDAPAAPAIRDDRRAKLHSEDGSARADARPTPMLWRVFAANAAVFALAFALLALSPVTIHARIRLVELVVLIAGLVVML